MGNQHKASRISTADNAKQWAAFDALPKSVRAALNDATYSWAPYPILKAWERGHWRTAKACIKSIEKADKEQLKKEQLKKERHANLR